MIDIKQLLRQPEYFKLAAKKRGVEVPIDEIVSLKEKVNLLIKTCDDKRYQLNQASKKKPTQAEQEKLRQLKLEIKNLEDEIGVNEKKLIELVELIPNPPFPDVPVGSDENDNVVIREIGKKPQFDFEPKDHMALAETLDLIDTVKAGDVSGSRFFYLKNEAVLLEFALIQFVYEMLVQEGFVPMIVPVFIKERYYAGMGRLSGDQRQERYYLPEDKLYLIGSAEHTIGPYHADEILEEKELPKHYLGFSTCFRREAGSYGKDVHGILRTHQFDKIEMFSFCLPENSEEEHQWLLGLQEKLMQALGLPYRVVAICTGDMGFTDARQYDLETWFPGQNRYRETHSCSNTTDFQARGINARFRRKNGEIEYLHMLNATAIAMGRTLIAIMENYQTKEGWIKVPEVLTKYTRFKIIKPK